ncbi:MAG: TetR/AcrR family transcriptional regulator [bacterium]|nr:TetR/AcrR family transcriptional regulator [bacterium]
MPVVRKVFKATLEQLGQVGFERLSVSAVAALAGVNKTSIYRRWPAKSDLVRAAISFSVEYRLVMPNTGNLRADLAELARLVANFMESPRGMGVVRTVLAEGTNPEVRELATSLLQQVETEFPRVIIKRAIHRGELPPGTDFKLITHTISGAIIHRIFIEQAPLPDAFIERLVDLVLLGTSDGQLPDKRQKKKRTDFRA